MPKTVRMLVCEGKYGTAYYLADTPARTVQALTAFFNQQDENGYYRDEDRKHLALARAGNMRAIKGILGSRQCYEYEEWSFEEIEVPSNNGLPREAGINYPALGLAGEGVNHYRRG